MITDTPLRLSAPGGVFFMRLYREFNFTKHIRSLNGFHVTELINCAGSENDRRNVQNQLNGVT